MNLDFQIGQMLMVGFRGLTVDESHPIATDIRERGLGGVVLFDVDVPGGGGLRNIQSPTQLKKLVQTLHTFSNNPLLVAIDHEGGQTTRLQTKYGFPPTRSHQALGTANDLTATYQQATRMAQTLAELGLNLNLAPVLDLNTNPHNPIIATRQRSFAADPQIVTAHALAFIKAHHQQGIPCTLKHFPGHGSATTDSHLGLVDVTESWSPRELEPYTQLIQTGLVEAIMTAHVFNANLDPTNPATLSRPILTHLLRRELNYNGLIISDDMQMGAIIQHYGFETVIQKSLEAGVDIIAIANNSIYEENIVARTITFIKHLVQIGLISPARITQSYRRIRQFKHTLATP